MSERLDVKLMTQSFVESGGQEVFPDLDGIGTVAIGLADGMMTTHVANKREIDEELRRQAKELGGSHVFKVEYDFKENALGRLSVYKATGTVYGPKVYKTSP